MATLVPINISLLSACLKEKNFQVELFDTTYYKEYEETMTSKKIEFLQIKPYDFSYEEKMFKKTNVYKDLKKKILSYNPNIIAITIVEDTVDFSRRLLKSIREYCNTPIIAGGVYIYFSPEEIINEKFIDMVCIGEGEKALVDICESIVNNKSIDNVPNIWVKKMMAKL
jgi:radical SAM superfamily enzyme YgiQ (UPF0313 family)